MAMALDAGIGAKVDEALEDLRAGLVTDGGDLKVTGGSGTTQVEVSLVLTPDACQECIVAPEMVESMVTGLVTQAVPSIEQVRYVDPRSSRQA